MTYRTHLSPWPKHSVPAQPSAHRMRRSRTPTSSAGLQTAVTRVSLSCKVKIHRTRPFQSSLFISEQLQLRSTQKASRGHQGSPAGGGRGRGRARRPFVVRWTSRRSPTEERCTGCRVSCSACQRGRSQKDGTVRKGSVVAGVRTGPGGHSRPWCVAAVTRACARVKIHRSAQGERSVLWYGDC